jgi:hypothetical protein
MYCLRSAKRRRVSPSGSPSTSQGSIVTAISLGATDTFDGRSPQHTSTDCKRYSPLLSRLSMPPSSTKRCCRGRWCMDNWESAVPLSRHSVIHDARFARQQHLAQQSQPFSIVWPDNTDSICDLQCLLTYMDNHANKRHKADATRSSTTNRSARRTSNGAAAPSSLPSPSSLPQPPFSPRDAPAAAPARTARIFAGISSRPGDLIDSLTRSGSFFSLANCSTTRVSLSSATFA